MEKESVDPQGIDINESTLGHPTMHASRSVLKVFATDAHRLARARAETV